MSNQSKTSMAEYLINQYKARVSGDAKIIHTDDAISERESKIRDYLKTTQDDPFLTGDLVYLLAILDAERLRIAQLKSALARIRNFPVHSEPVGGAYAMQDIADEMLYPNQS